MQCVFWALEVFGLYTHHIFRPCSPVADLLNGSQRAATPTTLPTASPDHDPQMVAKSGQKGRIWPLETGHLSPLMDKALRQTSICCPFWDG